MGISASFAGWDSQSEVMTQPDNDFTNIHQQEEFILSTVYPELKSYTWENPRPEEIIELRRLSIDVNSYPHMLSFDRAFFEILGRFDHPVPFYSRGYSFQKAFIKRLLDVILHPVSDDSEIYYSFVELFISRYAVDGVAVNEYGQIGEALVRTMASLDPLDGRSEKMWSRAYSRFIRAMM